MNTAIRAKPLKVMATVMIWGAGGIVALGLLLEVGIRTGIALGYPEFRKPGRYADWSSDEDYWKWQYLWGGKKSQISESFSDPVLGWATPKSPNNVLGANTEKGYEPDYQKPSVLFFGDAFVQGAGSYASRVPQKLEAALKGTPVFNLGMKGYGLDQIALRIQREVFPFHQPYVIFGVTTIGLDRSLLRFRTGPKPYYVTSAEGLVLRGIPVADAEQWLKENPPRPGSFLLRAIQQQWSRGNGLRELENGERREEKMSINRAILKQMVLELQAQRIPYYGVIFYAHEELGYEGWREKFIKEEFRALHVPYLDTKPVLHGLAKAAKKNAGSFYTDEGFPNEKANQAIAEQISAHVASRFSPNAVTIGPSLQ